MAASSSIFVNILGSDQTGRAFNSVARRNRGLRADVATTGRQISDALGVIPARGMAGLAAATAYLGKQVFQTQMKFDSMRNALFAATGSMAQAEGGMKQLAEMSDRLGVDMVSTTETYAKFAIAAKEVGFSSDQANDVFESVTKSSAAMGLSAESTRLTLKALEQMMSKGTVQAEELRGQLGEHLPGAFGLAAKAMGVSTAELSKMMAKGELLAKDLLPKLAVELDRTFGQAAEKASESSRAALNRLSNAWVKLKLKMSDTGGVSKTIASGMNKLTEHFNYFTNFGLRNTLAGLIGVKRELLLFAVEATAKIKQLSYDAGRLAFALGFGEARKQLSAYVKERKALITALESDIPFTKTKIMELQNRIIELTEKIALIRQAGRGEGLEGSITQQVRDQIAEIKADADEAMGVLLSPPKPLELPEWGGGGAGDTSAVMSEAQQKSLDSLRESLMGERELIRKDMLERQYLIDDFYIQELIDEQEHAQLMLAINKDYQDELADLEKKELERAKKQADAKRNILTGALGTISSLMNSENKKLFNIGKVAAISNATVSMLEGIGSALKYPPPLGYALAAGVAAAGAANIAKIRATPFGGGGGGGAAPSVKSAPAQSIGASSFANKSNTPGARMNVNINVTSPNGQMDNRSLNQIQRATYAGGKAAFAGVS